MLARFLDFINDKQLFSPGNKILLAVSGGIDSMVLLHLFQQAEFNYGVIHCNFQLRGDASDNDERLVEQMVEVHGVPAFFKQFDTLEYARTNGLSVEMAARILRYEYFEKVRKGNRFDFIATAHHQDDLIETFLLNLSRKTGIRGLSGIKEKTGNIIRPLLFANRRDIEEHARANFIDYREDHTNSEVIYQRNYIRHRIIPLFTEMNPAFRANVVETISNLRDVQELYSLVIKEAATKIVYGDKNRKKIDINALLSIPFSKILLFEILTEYNFNPSVIDQVYQRLGSSSGKQFYSKTHRLVKDRDYLFITPLPVEDERIFYIEEGDMELFAPVDITLEKIEDSDFRIIKEDHVACLDMDKLEFPLLIRKWQQGDYFQPLGMSGFKKLSDFFIDKKIPVHEKEKIRLLCCGPKIVWVMGYRIDDRFKITSETKHILKIEIRNR